MPHALQWVFPAAFSDKEDIGKTATNQQNSHQNDDNHDTTCIRIIRPAEANFIAMSAEHPVLDAASAGHLDTLQRELSSLSIDQPAHGIKDASGRNALHL